MTDSNAELTADTGSKPERQGGKNRFRRRQRIIAAMRQCMITKGYAETSLTDLANTAGMAVSHLLYYYASKEMILLDLTDEVQGRVFANVTSHGDEPPEERIHVLVENLFVRDLVIKAEMGIIREIVALSGHRPELKEKLSTHYVGMLSYLEDLFAQTPRQPGVSAIDAAKTACALWMGFTYAKDFDSDLSDSVARRLFRRTLLSLANFEGGHHTAVATLTPRAPRKPAAKRPTRKAQA